MTGNTTGYFLFSLDTELAWGHFDSFRPGMFSADGSRERKAIRRLLALCDEFGIKATWALVGQLFSDRFPDVDTYPAAWRGKYPAFEKLYRQGHPLLHGGDVIQMLLDRAERHEIAFHGFTHSAFDESEMDAATAEGEITAWLQAARGRVPAPTTVIFPRNRVGHLPLFKAAGFSCYRGVEIPSCAHTLPLLGRGFRRYNEELSVILAPQVYDLPKPDDSGLVNLPASRWLFGFNRRLDRLLDRSGRHHLRLQRIVSGVRKAAAQRKIIHLWAHPYEFQGEADFEKLRYVFSSVAQQVQGGLMQSVSMAALARMAVHHAAGHTPRADTADADRLPEELSPGR
jgi:peptidoglycan/xylan/chitin deacetylase (PgdA/CDA1 family)